MLKSRRLSVICVAIVASLILAAGIASAQTWHGNRQSTFSIYDPTTDTWQYAAYDDPNGLVGFDNNGDGLATELEGAGRILGQVGAWDSDGDGIAEIYILGGYPMWDQMPRIYDPASNSWSAGTPAGFWQSYGAVAEGPTVQVGSLVYQYGAGYVTPGQFGAYDMATDTWTQLAVGPDNAVGGTAAHHNGLIYVIGGDMAPDVLVYTIATNSWAFGPKMPRSIAGASSVTVGDYVYVFGGKDLDTNEISGDILALNMATNTWTTIEGGLPYAAARGIGAAVYDERVYLFGGIVQDGDEETYVRSTYSASVSDLEAAVAGASLSWHRGSDDPSYFPYDDFPGKLENPHVARANAAVIAANDVIYIIGGSGERDVTP